MAELNTDDSSGKSGKHSKKRAKKSSTKVDMTPMVDLAFLLLTFFVLTATFGKPKTMQLQLPVKSKDESTKRKVKDETAMTVLLSDNTDSIYYYMGMFDEKKTQILITNYSKDGIRKVLLEKNKSVIEKVNELKNKFKSGAIADSTLQSETKKIQYDNNSLTVMVKTEDKTKYKNLVDFMDELNITDVAKVSIGDISRPEQNLLKKLNL
jgi:biopolymer transport protein ExbD